MIEIIKCPVCSGLSWQSIFTVKDHSISHENFLIKKCSTCSILITSPRPDIDKLGLYYESENYISHSGKSTGFLNHVYLQARKFSLRWKLNIVKGLKPKGNLLDIGCGTGEFLKIVQDNGWLTSGVEPNAKAKAKAENRLGLKLLDSVTQLSVNQDIITMWHVLEHLPNLNESLAKIRTCLNPGGNLLIAVPNHLSKDALHYNENWAAFDVPRHLWHFNQKSMALLLQNHNFKIDRIIPMKLDSFYVSLLSEKYIAGGTTTVLGVLKGFLIGLFSNWAAKRTGEYSSLIYIASI